MTTFTSEDRIAAQQQMPTVIVDSGASIMEPIPFAGMVSISDQDFEQNLSPSVIKVDYFSVPKSA